MSTAVCDGTLTSSFSVSTVTTNANASTSITYPTTLQDATKNRLSMMEKSIAILGSALTRSTKSQKIPNGGISSNQKHRSRNRQRDRYSYYRKSRSRLPQRFIKSSRHYTVISMAVDHPPSISHLISLNWMLMMNTRNTPITMMLIRKMSCKVVVTI